MKPQSAMVFVKPIWRSLLILTWLSSLLVGPASMPRAMAAEITLELDTQVDSNDLRECTDQPGDCSLRGAITLANLHKTSAYVIRVPVGTYRLTMEGVREDANAFGDLDVYGRITLLGESAADTILEGIWKDRVLDVHSGAIVEVQDITIQGGYAPNSTTPYAPGEHGGGILNRGDLTLRDSVVQDNRTGDGEDAGSGGGIYNLGMIRIVNSTIMNNLTGTGGMGGGIFNGRRVELSNSAIIGNEGGAGAGGLDNHGAAYLTDCHILNNRGTGGGGFSNQAEAVLEGCTVDGNSGGNGGGIFNSSDLLLKESLLQDNDAAFGGGIYNRGSATLVDTQIERNITRDGGPGFDAFGTKGCITPSNGASPPGGGVYNEAKMTIDHSQISYNSTGNGGRGGDGVCYVPGGDGGAGGYGGGIYNSGSLELNMSSVDRNSTGNGGMGGKGTWGDGNPGSGGAGGGIYNSGTLLIHLSTLEGNRTGEGSYGGPGGGIDNEGQLTLTGSTVRDNLTIQDGNGGGIASSGTITINATTVISNTAAGSGGGFYLTFTTGQIANSILGHNKTGIDGSGLHARWSMLNLKDNTFAQNYGGDGSGVYALASTLILTNTILVSHTIGVKADHGSLVDFESTLWGSGAWANQLDWTGDGTVITGTHNYLEDPGFLDSTRLDYQITSASAAIDRGVDSGLDADIDFQPRPNPVTQLLDLGADEYWEAIPIETVSFTAPPTITRTTPLTLTATISPDTATPYIIYYWRPPPVEGQWTESALYAWQRSGVEKVTLMAINAASAVSETITITVEPVYSLVYLPVIGQ